LTVAHRRGREWYVGSITNWRPQGISLSLEFLGKGDFLATVYADAPDADTNPKNTTIEERKVSSSGKLVMRLASGGGQAIRIRPAP
jgi:alpha-glucosidase